MLVDLLSGHRFTQDFVGDAALTRLGSFDLHPEPLLRAVEEGISYAAQMTRHHPRGSFGTQLYEWTIAGLRNELAPLGWEVGRPDGLETTVHPSKLMQIGYSRGNEATGIVGRTPWTVSDKGPATSAIIDCNQFSFSIPGFEPQSSGTGLPTYLLLVWVDEATLESRVELSLPLSMSTDRRVAGWVERIHLPGRPKISSKRRIEFTEPASDPINVSVVRKAG